MEILNLKKLYPENFLTNLKNFLNDKHDREILEKQLIKTSIIISRNEYQINVKSINELQSLINYLNNNF